MSRPAICGTHSASEASLCILVPSYLLNTRGSDSDLMQMRLPALLLLRRHFLQDRPTASVRTC